MNKITVDDINFRGRKVLLRVDFNVPLDKNQNITDDRRPKTVLGDCFSAVKKCLIRTSQNPLQRPDLKEKISNVFIRHIIIIRPDYSLVP